MKAKIAGHRLYIAPHVSHAQRWAHCSAAPSGFVGRL
jgi:hypothetical protein